MTGVQTCALPIYWCEVFRQPLWTPEVISSRFILQNRKVLDDALEVGGAIVAMPHMGNYDLAGAWGTVQYGALSTIVERLKPESLYQQFVAHREALGVEILPLGDPDSFRTLVRRARDGGLICLLADRDITHSGVDVDFFGERARMPAGPATLSVLTGAALIPGTLWAEGETNYGRVGEPIPIPESGSRQEKVAAMTQLLANYFEGGIAERPADWHMMQPVFTADFDEAHLDLSGVGDRT